MKFDYDVNDAKSIEQYTKKLVGKTFREVIEEHTDPSERESAILAYGKKARKGALGNLIERFYLGYRENNRQEPDFKRAGVEVKSSPYDKAKSGKIRAGERLVLTKINFAGPFEEDFYKSHAWAKMKKLLIVYYCRNKKLEDILKYKIDFVQLLSPPENDMEIIKHDYEVIKEKIMSGRAHELSEGDTMYLGACTKGETAEKSIVPQYYGDKIPAKSRAFCLKRSYMDYLLKNFIACKKERAESVLEAAVLKDKSFEEYVIDKFDAFRDYSESKLVDIFKIEFTTKPKNLYSMLGFRMLGIKGNKAEEFEKANVVVKSIRIEANGKIKQHMSFPVFKFKELVQEEWESSTFANYLRDTRFCFVIYKMNSDGEFHFVGCQFWNIPYNDLEIEVKSVWERTKRILLDGLQFRIVNGEYESNLPKVSENRVCHVRPHGQNSADVCELPDGRFYPKQCFWLNNSYILEQLENRFK